MAFDPKKALQKNRVKIINGLANPDDVADSLFNTRLFTSDMLASVHQEPEKDKKIRYILDTLNRRGKDAVKGLHEAFLETENKELAELLAPYIKVAESEENRSNPSRWPPTEVEQKQMEQDSLKRITNLSGVYIHDYKSDKVYSMRTKHRGKVYVINNVEFTKMTQKGKETCLGDRGGSDKDVENLTQLFTQLHFDVICEKNLKAQDMLEFLVRERDKVKWEEMDCVVLIITSHGDSNSVYGVDGELQELKRMTDVFTSENCPGLNEKPRLVFVQACRGTTTEASPIGTGIQVSSDGQGISSPIGTGIQVSSDGHDITEQMNDMSIQEKDESDAVGTDQTSLSVKTVHSAADFLIAYATPEGTPAYRNVNVGSWFLNAVIWIFKYHADKMEIHSMLVRVNELVSKGRTYKGNLTVSEVKHNLRKDFFFFPGVCDDPPKLIN